MDIFPQDSVWHHPDAAHLFRIISSDLLSVTLQPLTSTASPITRLLFELLDFEQIIEIDDEEWYEADCTLFI